MKWFVLLAFVVLQLPGVAGNPNISAESKVKSAALTVPIACETAEDSELFPEDGMGTLVGSFILPAFKRLEVHAVERDTMSSWFSVRFFSRAPPRCA